MILKLKLQLITNGNLVVVAVPQWTVPLTLASALAVYRHHPSIDHRRGVPCGWLLKNRKHQLLFAGDARLTKVVVC